MHIYIYKYIPNRERKKERGKIDGGEKERARNDKRRELVRCYRSSLVETTPCAKIRRSVVSLTVQRSPRVSTRCTFCHNCDYPTIPRGNTHIYCSIIFFYVFLFNFIIVSSIKSADQLLLY